MADAVLLLTVTTPARVIRVASEPVELIDANGGLLVYVAGLDSLTVSLVLSWLSSGGALSVPVQCVLPFDLAEDEANGHHVAGCPAEVAVIDGDDLDYSERRILALGTVTGPEYGEIDEPVSFSIEGAASESQVEIPSITEQVDGTTWPDTIVNLPEQDLGILYPLVFGSPGATGDDWVTGSQGVWVSCDNLFWQLCIAGNQVHGEYVYLNCDANTAGLPFRVTHQRDALGQMIAFVDAFADYPDQTVTVAAGPYANYYGLKDAAAADFQALQATPIQVWVGWGKSIVDLSTPQGLSPQAGDVMNYLLRRASAHVDDARFAAAGSLLRGYRFDFVIDARVKILAWLAANVYPLLPISVESGPGGLYPVVWRYDATAEDATARVDADVDPGISRAGAIKETTDQIANAFSIQYRYSVRTGNYTETVTRDATTCPYCAASERRWGRIEQTLSTVIVYDAPTAAAVLAWRARAYTSPPKRIPYLVPSGYRLARGQVVILTDSRIHVSAQLCIVSAVQIDGTGVDGVEFLIVPDFPRDR